MLFGEATPIHNYMRIFNSCVLTIVLALLSGCATNAPKLQTGDYILSALNENSGSMDIIVSMSLYEAELYLVGPNNIWKAPVTQNIIGKFTPVKRSKSNQVSAFEGMFLQTIDGATIESAPNGFLKMRRNTRIVAIFEPMPDEVEATPTGK
ncbi:MAG: hypothetical protein ACI8Z5_002125 [Lentimonas sp.]